MFCIFEIANGEGDNGGDNSENQGDDGNQNGRTKRFPRRRNFNRRPRQQSENQDGAVNDAEGNENGQKPKPRRNRRFNRKRSDGGENQVRQLISLSLQI